MSAQFLDNILEYKKELIEKKKVFFARLKENINRAEYSRYSVFKHMISKPGQINLIAEIKKASPSKGLIRKDFDPVHIARIYIEHKVAAISVLTEDKYFLGKPDYVKRVGPEVNVPLLTKDFIIDEGQIYEARFIGASAILLIVAILDNAKLKDFIQVAHSLDLDCLVEVHDEDELNRALDVGAEIIGINNRNLRSFEVNLKMSEVLIPKIPKDKVIVAESGIKTHADIQRLRAAGAHAVLIGETLMRADDIGQKIEELMQYG